MMAPGRYYRCGCAGPTPRPHRAPPIAGPTSRRARRGVPAMRRKRTTWLALVLAQLSAALVVGALVVLLGWALGHAL